MPSAPSATIVWFRQDLRLQDQAALRAAVAEGGKLLPVFILDDMSPGAWKLGGASRWWLHFSLSALAADLAKAGAELVLRRGDPVAILPALAEEVAAGTIHAGLAHEPGWRGADARLQEKLAATGRALRLHRTRTLFDPETIKTGAGTPYGMFTPFARGAEARGEPEAPCPGPRRLSGLKGVASDRLQDWGLLPVHPDWAGGLRESWLPGEAAAARHVHNFLEGAADAYATGRNLPGESGTSRLSPYLHWGEISPQSVWHACRNATRSAGAGTFLRELIWREFAQYMLWHHPTLPDQPLRPAFAALPFRHDQKALRAWQRGQTGVPIVDAGMRQLWRTGWMHNRVRMIVASFLVKHLLIAWQEGAAWFWDTLVDADLGNNSTNWQWVTGCGIDSQPFFRIFNPVSQSEKFDPEGAYIRRFVPEIAALPDKSLHAPWLAPAATLKEAGIALGRSYPRPIVDLAAGRTRALAAYRGSVRGEAAA